MQTKFLRAVFLLTAISLILTFSAFAEPEFSESEIIAKLEEIPANSEIELLASSSATPFQAYLGVASVSYGAPNPSIGYAQETVPANTNIWIVEKVYNNSDGCYYYYAGYTYNSQSHRGYFNEYNVYYNGSKLNSSNITDESNPANSKQHTSLAGTVYDGPGTSYSVTGSVGQETITLIRTEGDYNFIEYTVTSNGKLKRGYLHYSQITGPWANLTAQIASRLNGKTFYVKNRDSGKYLDVKTWSTAENGRLQQYTFSGDPNQIFKFTYNSAGKYFTIQPANNYTSNRRLAINQDSNTQHAEKHLAIKTAAENTSQRFWVVEVGANEADGPHGYKLLPLSNYGTMTLTNFNDYINQYYTYYMNTVDTWIMEDTEVSTTANHFPQEQTNWCWIASTQCMASCEDGFDAQKTQSQVCSAVKGSIINEGGSLLDMARAGNYLLTENLHTNKFGYYTGKILTEQDIRRLIHIDHAVGLSMQPQPGSTISIGHAITLVKFQWIDRQGQSDAPGYYYYFYNDPSEYFKEKVACSYNDLVTIDGIFDYLSWKNTVRFNPEITLSPIDYYYIQ